MFNNGGEQNLDEFTQKLFEKLITATHISNSLPTEDEYQFYASLKPFKTKMNEFGKRLLDLTQNFLQHDTNSKAPIINDSDDVDDVTEKFDEVVDFVDRLIEKVVSKFMNTRAYIENATQGIRKAHAHAQPLRNAPLHKEIFLYTTQGINKT